MSIKLHNIHIVIETSEKKDKEMRTFLYKEGFRVHYSTLNDAWMVSGPIPSTETFEKIKRDYEVVSYKYD